MRALSWLDESKFSAVFHWFINKTLVIEQNCLTSIMFVSLLRNVLSQGVLLTQEIVGFGQSKSR